MGLRTSEQQQQKLGMAYHWGLGLVGHLAYGVVADTAVAVLDRAA